MPKSYSNLNTAYALKPCLNGFCFHNKNIIYTKTKVFQNGILVDPDFELEGIKSIHLIQLIL